MELVTDLWARAFTLEWLLPAAIIAFVVSFAARGLVMTLLMSVVAVVIDALIPLGHEIIAAGGLPADPAGRAIELLQSAPLDVAAARFVAYFVVIWVLSHAWADMSRTYEGRPMAVEKD